MFTVRCIRLLCSKKWREDFIQTSDLNKIISPLRAGFIIYKNQNYYLKLQAHPACIILWLSCVCGCIANPIRILMRQQMVSRGTLPPRPGSEYQWALFGDVSHWFITSQRFLIGFKSGKHVSVSGFSVYIIQELSKLWQHGLDSLFHQQKVWRWVLGYHPSAYEQSQQSVWPSQEIPPPPQCRHPG